MEKLQCRHAGFPIFAAPLISDRFRELTNSKNSCWLRHTLAVGLDAVLTTKIFQWFFRRSSFLLCSIYAVAPSDTHAYTSWKK